MNTDKELEKEIAILARNRVLLFKKFAGIILIVAALCVFMALDVDPGPGGSGRSSGLAKLVMFVGGGVCLRFVPLVKRRMMRRASRNVERWSNAD